MYLLDTDICSYIIRKHPRAALERLQHETEHGQEICISSITYAELRFGAARSQHADKYTALITEFCERLSAIQPWDRRAADALAKIQARLLAQGTPIGNNDAMIAGHAIALSATLVTNNENHFARVPDLTFETWVE